MKSCKDCKHADWKVTAAGRLHPSGDGNCKYPWKMPQIPAAMFWMYHKPPEPMGGWINRKTGLKDHCVYWSKKA